MGLLIEYFLAPSDEHALAVLAPDPSATQDPAPEPRRRWPLRRAPRPVEPPDPPAPSARGFDVLDGRGVEPTVVLGTLEAELTGRAYDDVADDREDFGIVGDHRDGQVLLVRLSDPLVAALADADAARLDAAADAWSRTEELADHGDPEALTRFLHRLAGLARDAREQQAAVYGWASL